MSGQPRRLRAAIVAAATVLLPALLAAQCARAGSVNKCVGANGKIVYQDAPCAEDSRSSRLDIPGSQPARPAAAPELSGGGAQPSAAAGARRPDNSGQRLWTLPEGSPYTRDQIEGTGETLAMIETCARILPKFAAENGSLISAWKSRNAGLIRAAEAHEVTGERIRRVRADTREATSDRERGEAELFCDSILVRFLGKKVDTAGFETPKSTWDRMIRALAAGKIDEAMESVDPGLREDYRKMFKAMDGAAVRKIADHLGTLHEVTLMGRNPETADLAIGQLHMPNNMGGEVHFNRMLGRWYVGQF